MCSSGDLLALPAAIRTAPPPESRLADLPASLEFARRYPRRPDAAPAARPCGLVFPASRAKGNLVGGGDIVGTACRIRLAAVSPLRLVSSPPSAPSDARRRLATFDLPRPSPGGGSSTVQRTPQQRVIGFFGDAYLRRGLGGRWRALPSPPPRGGDLCQSRGSSLGRALVKCWPSGHRADSWSPIRPL